MRRSASCEKFLYDFKARNIAKAAAARKLLTCVFYVMRDGQVRSLAARSHPHEAG